MKLSEYIAGTQGWIESFGDVDILSMPHGALSDFLPDDYLSWMLSEVDITLTPTGEIYAGVFSECQPDDRGTYIGDLVRKLLRPGVCSGDELLKLRDHLDQSVVLIDEALKMRR